MENCLAEVPKLVPPLRGGPKRRDVTVDFVPTVCTDLVRVAGVDTCDALVERDLRRTERGVWYGIVTERRL